MASSLNEVLKAAGAVAPETISTPQVGNGIVGASAAAGVPIIPSGNQPNYILGIALVGAVAAAIYFI
jgi:hypothetical protein